MHLSDALPLLYHSLKKRFTSCSSCAYLPAACSYRHSLLKQNSSTSERRFAPINLLGWEKEEVSSRLQRVGGTGATRRPLTVNAMIERFGKQEVKQDRDGEAVGTNAQSCGGYDSFVAQRCMTGPQFLDLAVRK